MAELITAYVWRPMGAQHEADLLLDPYGASRASGGLCGTARDMARVGQLLVDGGSGGPASRAVAEMKKAGNPAAWQAGSMPDFLPGAAYRSFWYQPGGDPGLYLAAGIYGQRIYVDVPRRVVIAQQASLPSSFDPDTWAETIPAFARIARTLAGQ
jgi:CubicO group peptidase (beta-lactamase class C family)